MASYGDYATKAIPRRVGVRESDDVFTAHFTTAGTSAPTIDSAKTRGVVSIARSGVGTFDITLPWTIRNADVQVTPWAYPAGAVANGWVVTHTSGTNKVTVTVTALSSGSAADTTGLELGVRIEGTNQ